MAAGGVLGNLCLAIKCDMWAACQGEGGRLSLMHNVSHAIRLKGLDDHALLELAGLTFHVEVLFEEVEDKSAVVQNAAGVSMLPPAILIALDVNAAALVKDRIPTAVLLLLLFKLARDGVKLVMAPVLVQDSFRFFFT